MEKRKETLGKVVVSNTSPENEKPTTIQDMMRKWNDLLGRQDALTQHISRYLLASYQRKFGNSIEKWEEYLNLLRSSEYVTQKMPTRVKSLILWTLKFRVIDRVLMGGFGVVKNFVEQCYENDREKILKEIEKSDEGEVCKSIRKRVLTKCGLMSSRTVMRDIGLIDTHTDLVGKNGKKVRKIIVLSPGCFIFDHVMNQCFRYLDDEFDFVCEPKGAERQNVTKEVNLQKQFSNCSLTH